MWCHVDRDGLIFGESGDGGCDCGDLPGPGITSGEIDSAGDIAGVSIAAEGGEPSLVYRSASGTPASMTRDRVLTMMGCRPT